MKTVGLVRRGVAASVDALCVGVVIALGFWVGVFERSLFLPAPGWFYPEWLLKAWLVDTGVFTTPIIAWCVLGIAWVTTWEVVTGRSPGARVVGIELVDGEQFAPRRGQLFARGAGLALQALTLGLGWLWGVVSPTRRTLSDVLSGVYAVRSR